MESASAVAAAAAFNGLLCKPTPLVFNSFLASAQASSSSFVAVAGSDISKGAQVFLLYEIPVSLLARRFLDANSSDKLQIMVYQKKARIFPILCAE